METKKRLALLDPRVDEIKLLCDEKSFNDVIKILSDFKLDDSNPFLQYYLNYLQSDKFLKYAVPEIQYFLQALKEKDIVLSHHENAINDYRSIINQIRSSKSWRITHPFTKKI